MDCGHDFILSVTNNKRCKQINKIFPPTFKESVPVQHEVSASYLYFAQGRDGAREKCRGGVDKKCRLEIAVQLQSVKYQSEATNTIF